MGCSDAVLGGSDFFLCVFGFSGLVGVLGVLRGCSGVFCSVLAGFWWIWRVSAEFGAVLSCVWLVWAVRGCSGVFRGCFGVPWVFWDVRGCFGVVLAVVLGAFWVSWGCGGLPSHFKPQFLFLSISLPLALLFLLICRRCSTPQNHPSMTCVNMCPGMIFSTMPLRCCICFWQVRHQCCVKMWLCLILQFS